MKKFYLMKKCKERQTDKKCTKLGQRKIMKQIAKKIKQNRKSKKSMIYSFT